MWEFEFSETEARRVLGEDWDLGGVRVHEDVYRAMSRGTFLETILHRHLYLDFNELNGHSCVVDACEKARDSGRGYATQYLWFGTVFKVTSDPMNPFVEVTLVDDDGFHCPSFETTFEDLLLEREQAEFEEEDEEEE